MKLISCTWKESLKKAAIGEEGTRTAREGKFQDLLD